jgi:hypothetical protein
MVLIMVGYKQRDKITNALRSRGDAIHTALTAYNSAAAAIGQRSLVWQNIVSMATLADFDLLRDVENSVAKKPWAKPQVRDAMTLHFRIKRAREEIHRLNLEIQRQITYMQDEHMLYKITANRLREDQPNLAAYIAQEGLHRDTIFTYITFYLIKTSRLSIFSGKLAPGTRTGTTQSRPMTDPPTWWNALQGETSANSVPLVTNEVRGNSPETSDDEGEGQTLLDLVENLAVVD